jgi:hypothetical protein
MAAEFPDDIVSYPHIFGLRTPDAVSIAFRL